MKVLKKKGEVEAIRFQSKTGDPIGIFEVINWLTRFKVDLLNWKFSEEAIIVPADPSGNTPVRTLVSGNWLVRELDGTFRTYTHKEFLDNHVLPDEVTSEEEQKLLHVRVGGRYSDGWGNIWEGESLEPNSSIEAVWCRPVYSHDPECRTGLRKAWSRRGSALWSDRSKDDFIREVQVEKTPT